MKHLRILVFLFIICISAFFILSFTLIKKRNFNESKLISSSKLDTNQTPGESLIPIDSIPSIPLKETKIGEDTIKLINIEPVKSSTDSIGLIKNEPIVSPFDSIGLIQAEIKTPIDSLGLIRKDTNIIADSLNFPLKTREDSIPRIEFRSVYADSIEQGNPNFMQKKVIEIKWISEKRDTAIRYKNIIGANLFYGIYTYGFGAGIFKRLSNDADFIANINLSYGFDNRSNEDIDSNSIYPALYRESRFYPIVFNVGLEKYFMQNRIDWKVKPVLIFGFAPAIIPVVPYELTFFKSLKKIQIAYGLGVFAALGFDWQAFKKFGINLTARYSFIPVIAGKDIYYYKGFLVKNVGGFYVNLGVTLLQEYFSKN